MSESETPNPPGDILIYRAENKDNSIRVLLEGETVWLTQRLLADLYQIGVNTINHHIKGVLRDGELVTEATIRRYRIVQDEGGRPVERLVEHYNLDMILAVGYRVRSPRGTEFRQWASARLGEYLVKGFTLDDERLKGTHSAVDHFDELLARIREIRASEARVYQRIRDIFAMATDYREGESETRSFFATVQNKMHYAATGLTAAEIVRRRADANQPNMGLTTWKGGQVYKRDVGTAKNYLDDREIDTLNRITVMYLDQADFRAQRRQDIRMGDWEAFLDKFLRDTELPVLEGGGRVSHDKAHSWAEQQYDAFAERRRIAAEETSDARYLEDLRDSAKVLETTRKPAPVRTTRGKKRTLGKDVGDKA